jgi:hypothetical protein
MDASIPFGMIGWPLSPGEWLTAPGRQASPSNIDPLLSMNDLYQVPLMHILCAPFCAVSSAPHPLRTVPAVRPHHLGLDLVARGRRGPRPDRPLRRPALQRQRHCALVWRPWSRSRPRCWRRDAVPNRACLKADSSCFSFSDLKGPPAHRGRSDSLDRLCSPVCAGLSNEAAFLSDLILLDSMTLRWTALGADLVSGQAPPGRYYHGFASVAGKAYVFGGSGYNGAKTLIHS